MGKSGLSGLSGLATVGSGVSIPPGPPTLMVPRYANFDLGTGANDGTTEDDAWQTWADMHTGLATGGPYHCFVKRTAVRFDVGSTIFTFTSGGDSLVPTLLEGYLSTPGDGAGVVANFFQWGSTTLQRRMSMTGEHIQFRFFDFVHLHGSQPVLEVGAAANQLLFYQCLFENLGTGGAVCANMGKGNHAVNCKFSHAGTTTGSYCLRLDASIAVACHAETPGNPTTRVVQVDNTGSNCSTLFGSIIKGGGSGDGVGLLNAQGDDKRLVMRNSIYNCVAGVRLTNMNTSGLGRNMIAGNIFANVIDGVDSDDVTVDANYGVTFLSNATGASGSTYVNLGDKPQLHQVSLSGDPWIDAANDDFTLDSMVGQGLLCRSVAEMVDVIGDGADVNELDIGAIQGS